MPKISELPAETTPADGDLIPIVDIAGVITKKITRDDLFSGTALPANTVTTVGIADSAVTPAKLLAGTGATWVWQSWNPTWTNLVVTGSTVNAKWCQIGKTVFFKVSVVLGGGNVPSGPVAFTFPVASVSYSGTATLPRIGNFACLVTNVYPGSVVWASTTTGRLVVQNVAGSSYPYESNIAAAVPNTFTNGSELHASGFYEAA